MRLHPSVLDHGRLMVFGTTRTDGLRLAAPTDRAGGLMVRAGLPNQCSGHAAPRVRAAVTAMLLGALIGTAAVAVPAAQRTASAATGSDDTVLTYGTAGFYGSTSGKQLAAPLVGMANTPDGKGYWLVANDGGVFSFGTARFFGSTGAIRLAQPIVGMASTPGGRGYWLVAADGGVFSFGSARFYGSTGGRRLNQPIIGMATAPDGLGYWLYARDGGIFSFGSAKFSGSTGAMRLNAPIVGMAAEPRGKGYWLVGSDGGVFAFGGARFRGSTGNIRLAKPVSSMAATGSGLGYWLAAEDGGVFTFGDAKFVGSAFGKLPLDRRVAQIAGIRNGRGYRLLALPIPLDTPVLNVGASGPAVSQLQARLLGLGYWIQGVDGHYGTTTQQAVYALQKVHGLPRTGVFDVRTKAVLAIAGRPVPRSRSGYVVEVDKDRQVVLITRNGRTEWVINTSTGGNYEYSYGGETFQAATPSGNFTVLRQIDGLRVGRLGSLWRPKYFTTDGIAFHGSPSIPPYPVSHGCVRMTNAAINWVWAANAIPIGTNVFVY
jgi:peptidoglycan hydrolase-like protein with peptidoglycan-binding domain